MLYYGTIIAGSINKTVPGFRNSLTRILEGRNFFSTQNVFTLTVLRRLKYIQNF